MTARRHSPPVKVESLAEAQVLIQMLADRTEQLEWDRDRHRELLDTFVETAAWRRWWFMLRGWSGHRLQDRPRWSPLNPRRRS